MALLLPPHRRS